MQATASASTRVGPAFILTPLVEQTMTPEAIAAVAPMHALGRWGRPEEVAEMTAWLLSDAASFATATFYPLDGGLLVADARAPAAAPAIARAR